MLEVAFELREAWARRVPTGELNRWFEAAVEANPPPAPGGQADQAALHHPGEDRPPSFVVFGNRTDELPESYRRYLVNAHAPRPQARRGAGAARFPRAAPIRSIAAGAKETFTLFALSLRPVGPRPEEPGS